MKYPNGSTRLVWIRSRFLASIKSCVRIVGSSIMSQLLLQSSDDIYVRRCETSLQDAKDISLKLLFNNASVVSQAYATRYKVNHPCYSIWSGDNVPSYPEPDLDNSLQSGPHQRARIQAIHSILRYPGLYDGGADCMFERMLHSAIRLLFEPL